MFAVGMAFGVTIAVGFLFVMQVNKISQIELYFIRLLFKSMFIKVKSVVKNQSGIEAWIVKKVNPQLMQFLSESFYFRL